MKQMVLKQDCLRRKTEQMNVFLLQDEIIGNVGFIKKIHFSHCLSQPFKGQPHLVWCTAPSVSLPDCLSACLTRWRTGFLISPLGVIIGIERLELESNEFQACQSCTFFFWWRPVGMLIVTLVEFLPWFQLSCFFVIQGTTLASLIIFFPSKKVDYTSEMCLKIERK